MKRKAGLMLWIALFLTIGSCGDPLKRSVGSIAPWVFDQAEFEVIRFDMFDLGEKWESSTEAIVNHPVGTNILGRCRFSGAKAKAILDCLRKSEDRPFFREPVELGNSQDCVLRFESGGRRADVAIDPDALIIVLYIEGRLVSFRTYEEPDPQMAKVLSPFLDREFPMDFRRLPTASAPK